MASGVAKSGVAKSHREATFYQNISYIVILSMLGLLQAKYGYIAFPSLE